jgi:hypothetical protein
MWLPLHITATYLESVERIAGRSAKGDHNYLGNLDHLIAYHQYLCALAADTNPGRLQFHRLSLFYIKELPEAPRSIWDAELHPRVSDFVFDDDKPGADTPLALVMHAERRLMALYAGTTAHLIPMLKGFPCTAPDAEFRRDAEAYFIGMRETQALLSTFDRGTNAESIRYFIQHVGAAATLWPNDRYLAREPDLQDLVTGWISAQLEREYRNIADSHPQISPYQAQALYNVQCLLRPETLLAGAAPEAALEIVANIDATALLEGMQSAPRCSIWKTAQRLRLWNFTRPIARAPRAEAPAAITRERTARPRAILRAPPGDRPGYPEVFGLDTPHLRAIVLGTPATRVRIPMLLQAAPDQPVSTSLSNWASLRARLISSRLAMTPRRSYAAEGVHEAPPRAASRRGCGGRRPPTDAGAATPGASTTSA